MECINLSMYLQVLLGIAQDNEIKLILSKMRIPTILENQFLMETSQMNYLELNSTTANKTDDRNSVLDLYCEVLTSLLNSSGSDVSQAALEKKAVVRHSHVC
jgi:hypothetical protein